VLESAGTASVNVTLNALPSSNVTVNYATSDGTAVNGWDYTATSGTLTFTPSQDSESFSVPILNPGITSADVALNLTLTSPTNATLGSPSTASLTIDNTDFTVPTASSGVDGIAVDASGNLWFTESTANKIGEMTMTQTMGGSWVASFNEYTIPTSDSDPTSIVAGPDGNMWFTEFNTGNIGVITPSGTITEYSTGGASPYAIAVGPDGNLWYTDPVNDAIGMCRSEFWSHFLPNCARPNSGRIFCQIKGVSILGC
jgi:streptogramin lyase